METAGGRDREYNYYKGLVLQKLGKNDEARQIFQSLLQASRDEGAYSQFDGRATSAAQRVNALYQAGLGYMGLGDNAGAAKKFEAALEINPGHIWSKTYLDDVK